MTPAHQCVSPFGRVDQCYPGKRSRFLHEGNPGVTSQPRDAPQFYLTSPVPLPLSAGQGGAESLHAYRRKARPRAERDPDARRLPPLADHRLPARLRYLPGLRVGAGAGRRVRAFGQSAARPEGQPRPHRRRRCRTGPTSEQYSLFRRYLDTRHADGGMADMTVLDYSMMVEDSHVDTRIIEYRRRGIDSGITGRGDGRPHRRVPDRRDERRPLHGLFVLRSGAAATAASAPS